ncbi:hypothetical protein GLX30_03950 [Streptomyces sp. Tu 2975]|uniref:DUF6777 domain-containing protein n=1 Tax=Streptomyces sp. Tu 2975 TaxID=2676871 RepID=UPI0013588818|nr:DUF6777 domain-containing protein [Streptomyces sp. Tu 2975]QIP83354.1 hypothetical protein GLX30_03950 [Streptomyces sp. Tu 2975]
MRSPMRGLYATVAVLCLGPLAAGCGGDSRAAEPGEILLQSLAAPGPDPFTASTVTAGTPPALPVVAGAPKSPSGGGVSLRTMSGATPGLYAGIQGEAACDVGRQAGLLAADKRKAKAFAEAVGVERSGVAAFLRGLTPVVLRVDVRVTGHGFHDGAAVARQSVLQAGTAVLVDEFGAPRVRCASGAPLKQPVAIRTALVNKGEPWSGYRADRVIVIKPAAQAVNNLLLVSAVDNGWIERPGGTEGEDDAGPAVLPPVDPDEVFGDPSRTAPGGAVDSAGAERATPEPRPSAAPPQPQLPVEPAPVQSAPPEPPVEPDVPAAPQPDLPADLDQGVPDIVEPEPVDPGLTAGSEAGQEQDPVGTEPFAPAGPGQESLPETHVLPR